MRDGAIHAIESAVRSLLDRHRRLVLAVSGGVDSAVLLDTVARLRTSGHHVVVASVDHGTGAAATESTARAVSAAARLGMSAITERLEGIRPREADWRRARWAFLNQVAASERAPVVTAHTEDDQIETVVMRILRGAGARGLAGLYAPSPVERPFLNLRRAAIAAYATRRKVEFTDDPTNESRRFLRNRVRLDLLPALRNAAPALETDLLRLAREAARVREAVDRLVGAFVLPSVEGTSITLNASRLVELTEQELLLVLPSIVTAAGVTLDRRGLIRLASVVRSQRGSRGQLSGGVEAVQARAGTVIVPRRPPSPGTVRLRRSGETRFGAFRFVAEPAASIQAQERLVQPPWRIDIPRSAEPIVRSWHAGDRLTIDLKGGKRRVKRFFADAGLPAPLRPGWPVVLLGEELVWIPGIKASQDAVPAGRGLVRYTCERIR